MRAIGYIGVFLALPMIAVGLDAEGAERWMLIAGGLVMMPLSGYWVRPPS